MAIGLVIDDLTVTNGVGQKNPMPVRIKDATTGNDVNVSSKENQTNGTQKTKIVDSTGAGWELEQNGAMPVNIQDQTSTDVDFFLREILNIITLALTITIDTYQCTLVAGHNVVNGDVLVFKEGTHFFQGIVLNVATNIITIDRPFDYAFTTVATAQRCNINMNVDGSTTPRIFHTSPAGLTNTKIDYTKLHFYIEDNVAMTGATFGGLTLLTRGVTIRSINGTHKVHFNVKSNGEFGLHCDDLTYNDRAAGSSIWSFTAVKRFAGQHNQGVAIRMDSVTSDQLQIIIQDDLTGLTKFNVTAQGHVVTN